MWWTPAFRNDPRFRSNGGLANRRFQQRFRGSSIILVPYGYYDGYNSYGAGQVYDVNGRPLSETFEPMAEPMPPSVSYGYGEAPGYTPDLTGSPYAITDEGMMVVDFPSGERRAFPSCAAQADLRDPQGRPRTIFYQQSDYWMILRPGQRGRVQGEPPAAQGEGLLRDRLGGEGGSSAITARPRRTATEVLGTEYFSTGTGRTSPTNAWRAIRPD